MNDIRINGKSIKCDKYFVITVKDNGQTSDMDILSNMKMPDEVVQYLYPVMENLADSIEESELERNRA